MKNKIGFLIILLFCVLLTGCKAGNPETTEKTIQEASTEAAEGPSTTEDETEEPTTLSSRKIVILEEEQLSQESILTDVYHEQTDKISRNIEFPKLAEEVPNHEAVNCLLEECAKKKMDEHSEMDNKYLKPDNHLNSDICYVDCEYKVSYYTQKYLSVVFESYFYHVGAAHPTFECYGVTIDIEKGKIVPIEEVGIHTEDVQTRVKNNDYTSERGCALFVLGEEKLQNKVQDTLNENEETHYQGVFYRDADSVYMVLTSLEHSYGDYGILKFTD